MKEKKEPIDVVISWVDGNDPLHKQKMNPYLEKLGRISDDLSGPTRFRSVGEIYFCVASIYRFAPFVRKIFIITDNQNPDLDEFIQQNFPESKIEIEIIDHTVLFRGFEHILPVFNSRTIETCTYRIPGLSENYIYMNDDFFLVRPINYEDWYFENKIIAYGHWRSIILDKLLWLIKPLKNGHKPVGFKDSMITSAIKLKKKWRYFHLEHVPHPLKRSVLDNFFSKRTDLLNSNTSFRFRSAKQFNTQALYYLLMFDSKRAIERNTNDLFLYIKPVNREKSYIARKLKTFEDKTDIKFCCIGSLDLATDKDKQKLIEWLTNILQIKHLPKNIQ